MLVACNSGFNEKKQGDIVNKDTDRNMAERVGFHTGYAMGIPKRRIK